MRFCFDCFDGYRSPDFEKQKYEPVTFLRAASVVTN